MEELFGFGFSNLVERLGLKHCGARQQKDN
jgi:hypothetical protein